MISYVVYVPGRGYSGPHRWFYKNIVSAKFYVYEKSAINAMRRLKKRYEKAYVRKINIEIIE